MFLRKMWLSGSKVLKGVGLRYLAYSDTSSPSHRIQRMQGGSEVTLSAHATLTSTTTKQVWARPPIDVDFQVLMFTASGLIVRFLKVFEKSSYQSVKWVRYLTKASGSYQIRVSHLICHRGNCADRPSWYSSKPYACACISFVTSLNIYWLFRVSSLRVLAFLEILHSPSPSCGCLFIRKLRTSSGKLLVTLKPVSAPREFFGITERYTRAGHQGKPRYRYMITQRLHN